MSTNEELIAEARRAVLVNDHDRAIHGGLVGRLADALEVAVADRVKTERDLRYMRDGLHGPTGGPDWFPRGEEPIVPRPAPIEVTDEPRDDDVRRLSGLLRGVYGPLADTDAVSRTVLKRFGAARRTPIEVTDEMVTILAKHMAHAALDWVDFEADEHDHTPECSNWGAYRSDARIALTEMRKR